MIYLNTDDTEIQQALAEYNKVLEDLQKQEKRFESSFGTSTHSSAHDSYLFALNKCIVIFEKLSNLGKKERT